MVYSTSAGRVAQDGTGRNSVFTEELIQHLRTPGIDISEVLRRTGEAVQTKTAGLQIPAIYSQFFGFLTLAEEGSWFEGPEASVDLSYLPEFFDTAPEEVKSTLAKAEQLAQSYQALEGWGVLMDADPSHEDPYILAGKIRFALAYSEESNDYRKFAFCNTGDPETTYWAAKEKGTLVQEEVKFDPHSILQSFKGKPEDFPPVLALELGTYYYRVYSQYPRGWPLRKEDVRDKALSCYRVAETKGILIRVNEIVSYSELLTTQGKADEATVFLRKKMETLSPDANDWERLWEHLLDTYVTGGKAAEALKEIDTRIRSIPADAKDLLFALNWKGADISIQSRRKADFERYVRILETQYPDRWDAGVLRHRFALVLGDTLAVREIAERLYRQFPIESIAKENILETVLENYFINPTDMLEGLVFLESQIKIYQGAPKRLFELYMYRAAYRVRMFLSDLEESKRKQAFRESLADLERAEVLYKSLPSQDDEILSILQEGKQAFQKGLNTGSLP